MISSAASPSASSSEAESERHAFIAWCSQLGIGGDRAEYLATVPSRDTYDGLLRYRAPSPFRGAEFSVRSHAAARLAFAPRSAADPAAWIRDGGPRVRPLVDAVRAMRGVDLLLGTGEAGEKLYLQRPHDTTRERFRDIAAAWLELAGGAPANVDPDFVCVDFTAGGGLDPKIYAVTDEPDRARMWLGDSPLAAIVNDLPAAQFVVTFRRRGLTLHARLFDAAVAYLDASVAAGLAALRRATRRRLVPTHLSWSEPDLRQTLYYMVDADD